MSSMSLNTEDSKNSVNTVKKLAKMFSLGLRDIPDVIKENADKVLEVIENMCIDDPIVIIKWTVPFPRNVRGQTERSLINHIVTNGGTNEFNSNVIFSFRSGRQLTNCVNGLPLWCRHDRVNPNVPDVGYCYRATRVSERSADLEVEIDKIKLVSYSTTEISKLTNAQIRNVIDQVILKTNQTNLTDAQVNPLVSTEEDLLMKEIMEGIERVEKEKCQSKVVTATKIHIEYDDVYFDGEDLKEEANEVKSDDENVSSDSEEERRDLDDGYNGYGHTVDMMNMVDAIEVIIIVMEI
ncbi:uncharacterized protein OCT59_011978 [Rhizophagus irregularis]|uniref:Uncharacterized protein n=1 Tax=Rhizophagus irregularis (strain DAOM 197198w) TaxID=1432141 RepID=A0A015I8M1_RHIIW|nr:hypothetical protein RirG_242950 [Rhizophagus irregularis DAOM 197198w]UZO00863.1 hypothetical protein OCT59_011978 [Rhizophagus irregularis]